MDVWQRRRLLRGPGPLRPVEAAGVREAASVGRFQEFAAAFDADGDCSRGRRRNPPRSFDREALCRGIGRRMVELALGLGLLQCGPARSAMVRAYDRAMTFGSTQRSVGSWHRSRAAGMLCATPRSAACAGCRRAPGGGEFLGAATAMSTWARAKLLDSSGARGSRRLPAWWRRDLLDWSAPEA